MIRADWTPLWAADSSNRKRLGPKQVACLELLRDRGPLTRKELRAAGIGLGTTDALNLCYPRLLEFGGGHPQRISLAAPSQQAELDKVLAIIAEHPDGITWQQLSLLQKGWRWGSTVQWHLASSGQARYQASKDMFWPAAPGEAMTTSAGRTGRRAAP